MSEFIDDKKQKLKEYEKQWTLQNKDRIKEKKRKYYEENKQKILEKQKKYYEENREEMIEKQKKYYEENREEINKYKKIHHEDNKEEIQEKQRNYYEDNKEGIQDKQRNYYEDNKEGIKEKHKKYNKSSGAIKKKIRRHREEDLEKGRENDIHYDYVVNLLQSQEYKCKRCNILVKLSWTDRYDKQQFSINRINNDLGHIMENIEITCLHCNRVYHNK